jgi:GT2 family glycosyltransferase
VGTIISKAKMLEVGLTRKEFFIGCDDTEHSLRLSKVGSIYCIPSIKVHHDFNVPLVKANYYGVSWRTYYEKRNHYFTYCEFYPRRKVFWYYFKMYIKDLIITLLKTPAKEKRIRLRVIRDGLKDGRKGKLGIHPVYVPGWPNSSQKGK